MNPILNNEKFCKDERLYKRYHLEELFSSGKSFKGKNIRLVWKLQNDSDKFPVQLLIGVSKKTFKRANKRNHIKRLIREVYRRNKTIWYKPLIEANIKISVAVFYTSKEFPTFECIQDEFTTLMNEFINYFLRKNAPKNSSPTTQS